MAGQRIAVFFGGRSVEHDISILTGLQFLDALDPERFEGFPVYIDPKGQFWTGDRLRTRDAYPLTRTADLQAVTLPAGLAVGRPALLAAKKGVLGLKTEPIPFDLAVPALHGTHGEDGAIQGLFDFCGIPYAGPRALAAAAAMDKHFTKELARQAGVAVLPHALIARPPRGQAPDPAALETAVTAALGADPWPVLVKPRRLGSSIGVAKADDADGLLAALLPAFRIDDAVLVEPLVANLVEYNIAVRRRDGRLVPSAIERPLREADLLDFQTKYLAQGGKGAKKGPVPSAGMAGTNREIEPADLTEAQRRQIRNSALSVADRLGLTGSARVDFLCDGQTGALWFNEVNTLPGSFAFYLWTVAEPALDFTGLTTALIEEGLQLAAEARADTAAAAGGAQVFGRG